MSAAIGTLLAALAFASLTAPAAAETPSPLASRPNVVLVLVDTLRADRLGVYGAEPTTSPSLDRIADESIVFDSARTTSNWTNPSIASLFTGRYPRAVLAPALHPLAIRQALPSGRKTLAEHLREAGYATFALVDHPGINRDLGFARGFDDYVMLFERDCDKDGDGDGDGGEAGPRWAADPERVRAGLRRVVEEARRAGKPFFVYLHLVYPHWPYQPEEGEPAPPDRSAEAREELVRAYDAEIRRTDALLGDLVADLGADLDRTWLVFTADHGEGFWEHGFYDHGASFHEEMVRVPLLLRPPGGSKPGKRVATSVSQIDLFPTLLELAGAAPDPGADGESLRRFFGDSLSQDAERATVIASPHSYDVESLSVVEGRWKYVRTPNRWWRSCGKALGLWLVGDVRGRRVPFLCRAESLYDLESDPEETNDVAAENAEVVERLRAVADAHVAASEAARSSARPAEAPVDPKTAARLRAMGYTQ